MPLLRLRLARRLLALFTLVIATGSCGPDLLGPGGTRRAVVALNPEFSAVRLDGSGQPLSISSIVSFTRVRVVLLRTNGDTVVDRMVDFPADADSVALAFNVTLSPTAPAEGESLGATMRFLTAAGDTVFAAGPVSVQARPTSTTTPPAPVTIPVSYVGPGKDATSLIVAPDSVVAIRGQTFTLTATARDAQGAVLPNTPVAYTSSDTTQVRVTLGGGVATIVGARGSALVIAQTLTGQRDTARISITPTPTAIAVVSGNNQQVRQGSAFAQPLRVRVTAIDGLGVSGTPVDFAVTSGLGTLSAARVTTDTAGFAEVIWAAGDTAMVGSVVASVGTPNLSVTFSGTQLSSGPTSLVFAAQPPATVVTGDTLTSVKVVVLDATLDTVRTFAGAVTLTLTGGPAGASLLGTATVNAVAGVARFPGLSVNRAGTGYRLNAQLPGRPAVATVPSIPFTATQAPPALVELLTGSGRVTVGGAPFPDSIRVWVKDRFGIGVPGATVNFTIVSGGGSVSPAPATTNADGIAAARWTAGLTGPQSVDVTVAGVAPVRVTGAIPSAIVVSSGSGQSALFGQPFPLPVIFTVLGDSGNVLASAPVALTVTGGGTISATQTFSDAQGLVRVNWTAGSVAGTATVTATIPGTTLSATASGQQGSAAPSFLAFAVPPRGIVAGDTIPATVVAIYNGVNELLPNYRGTMSVALIGGTPGARLLGPTTVPVDSGSSAGWFRNLTVDRAGTGYRLVATLANSTLTVTSDTFSVAPAPAVALTLTSGGGQQALGGTTLPAPVVVTAVDQFGFPVRGVPVTFTTANSGASVSVGSATTDSLGRASTQWTVGLFGSQLLTVNASGVAGPLTVRATIPQALTLVSGGGQSALFGQPFPTPISFRVLGDSARPMAGIPVDFSVFGGGTVSQVRDTSDATGLVSVTWTAGTLPGSATLTATVAGMSLSAGAAGQQASPAPSLLTLTGAPSQVVAGDSMPPVQVQVLNGLGQPVTNYTGGVRLTLGGGAAGAQLLGTTVRQAVAGVATFPGLAIDRAGSGYRLFAALDPTQPGLQTNSDTITVTPAPPTGVVLVSGGGQTAPEFIPLADSIVVRVVDRFGFGVPGVTVQFAVQSGAGTVSAASVVSAGGATPGRAAVRWTVGPVGAQQLKVGLPGVPDLVVSATSISASGPPLLFIGQGDGASLRIGQPSPITLFLTSPSPTPVEVTFSTTDPAVVNWEVPSWPFAAGTTQLVTELLPVGVGSAVVRVTSSAGSDSLVVYVDSATVGFRDPSWAYAAVGDTIQTQVVLDAPAPLGGTVVTVTSADPTALLVAPGTGRGLSDPSCTFCGQLQAADTGATGGLVAPPGASATVQILAGQLSGELVLLPIGLPTAGTGSPIAISVSATGRVGNVRNVVIDAPTLSAFPWDATLPVGHLVQGGIEVGTPMRRAVPVTIRTLDPTILAVRDSVASVDAFDYGTSDLHFARALAVGIGRLVVESPGFVPDTISVTVAERRVELQSLGATSMSTGQEVGVRALLGVAPSQSNGFIASAPTASPVPVTFVSLDTTVIRVLRSERSADGVFDVIVGLRAVGTGIAPIVASAPGYGADTLQFLVSGVTPSIALSGPLTPGVVATVDVSLGTYGVPQASSVEYTVTAGDSTILGVLTPILRIPAGFQSGTLRLEARAPGSTTLSLSAPGMTTTVQLVTVAATGSLAYVYAPSSVIVDSTGSYASVYLSGEAATRTVLQVRSTNPAVLAVIDSVLTIPAGAQYGGAPRVRGLAPGAAQLILRRDGVDIDTSTTVQVVAPSITAYVEGNAAGVVSLGPDTRVPMVIEVSQQAATNLTFTVRGPLGTTIVAGDSLPLESWGGQPVVLRGSASMPTSGIDTVTITRPGASPFSFFVTPSRIRSTVLVGPIALGQAAQVGAYVGLADGPTPAPFIESRIPRRFRVVSLDTTRLRVVEDTLKVESDGVVSRHAFVRAVGVGNASVVLLPIDAAATTLPDTTALFIDRARLYSPFYPGDPLRLGMQQRTFAEEVYIERSTPSVKPLWVRLRSSAPSVATVPDSVLIPADSTFAFFPVTAGDSVGTARVTASAALHVETTFEVAVVRTRLAPHTPFVPDADLTTGGRTTLDVYVVSPDDGYGGGSQALQAPNAPFVDLQSPVGTVRASTVPIPVRLVINDTTVLAAVRDTATIPANGFVVRTPGIIGKQVGLTRARLEDRRTVFAQLAPSIGIVRVAPAQLRLQSLAGRPRLEVPFLVRLLPGGQPMLTSTGSADTVPVQITSRLNRVAPDLATPLLVVSDSAIAGFGGRMAPVGLRGLALGIDTVIVTAPGHRPDTVIVEVTAGAIAIGETGPLPASLTVGDSVFVQLSLRDATGEFVEPITPIQLNIATTPTVAATLPLGAFTSAEIDGGESFTCARRPNGTVYCWGSNGVGQTGTGTTTDQLTPTLVGNGMTFTSLTVGGRHACGIATSGVAYCWGDNFYGQLGNSTTTGSLVPTVVEPGFQRDWVQLSAGGAYTCGRTTDGVLYCWGRNTLGQLGNGTLTDYLTPAMVSVGTRRFSTVTTGTEHTCAIEATTKLLFCWGGNLGGKLGDGTTTNRTVPTQISNATFAKVSAGGGHTCGILLSGQAYCWGENINGSVGSGSFSANLPTPTEVAGGLSWSAIAAGGTHTCGVSGGNVYCWGYNSNGQVGDSTLINRRTPVFVGGDGTVLDVGLGGSHSCGRSSLNETACWGANQFGALGDGTITDRTRPIFVSLGNAGAISSVTLQPGMMAAGFWLRGVSAGAATVTVTTPGFGTFQAALTVRTP